MSDCFIKISITTYNPLHIEERGCKSMDEAIKFLEAYKIVMAIT